MGGNRDPYLLAIFQIRLLRSAFKRREPGVGGICGVESRAAFNTTSERTSGFAYLSRERFSFPLANTLDTTVSLLKNACVRLLPRVFRTTHRLRDR